MKSLHFRLAVFILLLLFLSEVTHGFADQYVGGSISNSVELDSKTGNMMVHIDMVSFWDYKKSVLGATQGNSLRNGDILRTKQILEQKYGRGYFGKLSIDGSFGNSHKNIYIGSALTTSGAGIGEILQGYSKTGSWEIHHMTSSFNLNDLTNAKPNQFHINFDGNSFHFLNLQGGSGVGYHLQSIVQTGVRNDTGIPNRSPIAFTNPIHRVILGQKNYIHISAVDPDGDYVFCEQSQYREIGELIKAEYLQGIKYHENCTVEIFPDWTQGYKNDTYVALAITVRDMNREPVTDGANTFTPYSYSLSAVGIQFLLHVVDADIPSRPHIALPTFPDNHEFTVYVGTTWHIPVYFSAPGNSTSFSIYVMTRPDRQVFYFTPTVDKKYPKLFHTKLEMRDTSSRDRSYTVCIQILNEYGYDLRCFIVHVVDREFSYTTPSPRGTYFIKLPDPNESIKCLVGTTTQLRIPIVTSSYVRGVNLTANPNGMATIGEDWTFNGTVFIYDLYVTGNTPGNQRVCFIATADYNLESDETCIRITVYLPNPCRLDKCGSGLCKRDSLFSTQFTCSCYQGYWGQYCDQKGSNCIPHPCAHGRCFPSRKSFFCYCDAGFTGKNCAIKKNSCEPDDCSDRGICVDGPKNKTCSCYGRYSGSDCSTDLCPSEQNSLRHCPNSTVGIHIPCNNGGISHQSDSDCRCRLGFSGKYCEKEIKYNEVGIVPPSLEERSEVTCIQNIPCVVPFYFVSPNRNKPLVTIGNASNVNSPVNVSNVAMVTFIDGVTNIYTANITLMMPELGARNICIVVEDTLSLDVRCVIIAVVENPLLITGTLDYKQQNATYKFVDPTLQGESKIKCIVNETCAVLLFTSLPTSGVCHQVLVSDSNVFPFRSEKFTHDTCVTEVSISTKSVQDKYVCFQASQAYYDINRMVRGETRCFNIDIVVPETVDGGWTTWYEWTGCSATCGHGSRHRFRTCDYPRPKHGGAPCHGTNMEHDVCVGSACEIITVQPTTAPSSCASQPCHNNASCENLPGTFHCHCAPGYQGQQCDQDQNECLYNRCMYGGSCLNTPGGYRCVCTTGYTGQDCQFKADCTDSPSLSCWQLAALHMCHDVHVARECPKSCNKCSSGQTAAFIG